MTPYRPLDQAAGGNTDYEFFVLRGAAYIEADERGTGGSEGCLDFGVDPIKTAKAPTR